MRLTLSSSKQIRAFSWRNLSESEARYGASDLACLNTAFPNRSLAVVSILNVDSISSREASPSDNLSATRIAFEILWSTVNGIRRQKATPASRTFRVDLVLRNANFNMATSWDLLCQESLVISCARKN